MVTPAVMLKNAGAVLGLLALVTGTAALAQRDPAYAAARASGAVGERMDGYLGVVAAASAQIRSLVADINIKRKQIYFEQATENRVTAEQYAFSAGCTAIVRTAPGEKYQAPDGSWETRTSGPPLLHPQCPR